MNNKTEIRITVEEDANSYAVRVDMDGSAKGITYGLGAAVNDFCESENIPLPVFFMACMAGKAHDLKKKRCFHPCAKFQEGQAIKNLERVNMEEHPWRKLDRARVLKNTVRSSQHNAK